MSADDYQAVMPKAPPGFIGQKIDGVDMDYILTAVLATIDANRPHNIDGWFDGRHVADRFWAHCIAKGIFECGGAGLTYHKLRFTPLGKKIWGTYLLATEIHSDQQNTQR